MAFAAITRLRRRGLVLGVRQDFPVYVRSRRHQRWMHAAADALEYLWRRLARHTPVIVVGPALARQYVRSPAVLDITVSLITEADIESGRQAAAERRYDGSLIALSVGRLDQEKNPLLLADILERLRSRDDRWRLVVCGEGPLAGALVARLAAKGLSAHADLRGYVPLHGGLLDLYRQAHVFLHISLTEGKPQVLAEAFASGLPVVATAVGGVAEAADGAALLIAPEDPCAAAKAAERLAGGVAIRDRLIETGFEKLAGQTLEQQTRRVVEFIARSSPSRGGILAR
ncbi:MAG: glycosyltransferase [Solirubrobacteraceae bacterium]